MAKDPDENTVETVASIWGKAIASGIMLDASGRKLDGNTMLNAVANALGIVGFTVVKATAKDNHREEMAQKFCDLVRSVVFLNISDRKGKPQ